MTGVQRENDMRTSTTIFTSLLVVSLAGSPYAAQQAPARSASAATTVTAGQTVDAGADYVIGPDDLLSIVIWRDQQLSGDVLVRPDGKISLPLIDEIQAAGLTPRQLRDRIVTEARRFVSEPIATVTVRQVNSRKVYITGLVAKPGQYPLAAGMTVLQLIATAGGLLDYAKANDIRVVRTDEAGQRAILRFDYEQATKDKSPTQHVELKPGDTVVVR